MTMDWRKKAKLIHELVVKRWPPYSDEDQRFLALALAGEVGEFCNVVKKLWRGDNLPTAQAMLEEELADIRIYLELCALSFGIDLDQACEGKMPELERRWPEVVSAIAAAQAKAAGE
jgi:NTP pyrophosphatase (non-canonical NTP hydrolase)